MKIAWEPQPRQKVFMSRPEYEVLYGGAAGGGKSDAILCEALRQVHIPSYKGLILRRTFPQLSELMDRSINLYSKAFPSAKFNESKYVWKFGSGAKIYFGNLQRETDKYNYQGKAYDFIAFDELTHFTRTQYMYLMSRNRPTAPGTRVYIRASANPGGVGHGWVKKRFITPAPPMTRIKGIYKIVTPTGELIERVRSRMFVPSTVFDNKKLLENDPYYIANLAMLPEADKKALLYGDWNSFSGQVFTEWNDEIEHYLDRKWTHVISPFKIPETWRIFRGFDWGYSKPFSVGWYAVDNDNRLYRINELYGCTDQPNTGVKWTTEKIAKAIKEIEESDPNLKGRTISAVADPAIFQENGGKSIADSFMEAGVYWEKGDHTRIPGKMQCHYRLAFDENGIPMFYCFSNCKDFIRTVPELIYSETKVEDINTEMEDHIYDEWRYVCMESPINERRDARAKLYEGTDGLHDPLNMIPAQLGRYDFFKYM